MQTISFCNMLGLESNINAGCEVAKIPLSDEIALELEQPNKAGDGYGGAGADEYGHGDGDGDGDVGETVQMEQGCDQTGDGVGEVYESVDQKVDDQMDSQVEKVGGDSVES
jgi:hypothetical protein